MSIYSQLEDTDDAEFPQALVLSGQREGLLLQSIEIITGSSGEICIFAGDLSWLREIQPILLFAALEQRRIRIIVTAVGVATTLAHNMARIAAAIGAEVAISDRSMATRATLIAPGTATAMMVVVEKSPALHGSLYRSPHDNGMIDGFAGVFENVWAESRKVKQTHPQLRPISETQLVAALRAGVWQYAKAKIELSSISPESVLPLPCMLERLKLFRQECLVSLRTRHGVVAPLVLEGSPWPFIPPVVEILDDKRKVIIDGAHRFYLALNRGEEVQPVVIVKGAAGGLPATPQTSWDDVKAVTAKLPRNVRYVDYNNSRFRSLRRACEAIGTEV